MISLYSALSAAPIPRIKAPLLPPKQSKVVVLEEEAKEEIPAEDKKKGGGRKPIAGAAGKQQQSLATGRTMAEKENEGLPLSKIMAKKAVEEEAAKPKALKSKRNQKVDSVVNAPQQPPNLSPIPVASSKKRKSDDLDLSDSRDGTTDEDITPNNNSNKSDASRNDGAVAEWESRCNALSQQCEDLQKQLLASQQASQQLQQEINETKHSEKRYKQFVSKAMGASFQVTAATATEDCFITCRLASSTNNNAVEFKLVYKESAGTSEDHDESNFEVEYHPIANNLSGYCPQWIDDVIAFDYEQICTFTSRLMRAVHEGK